MPPYMTQPRLRRCAFLLFGMLIGFVPFVVLNLGSTILGASALAIGLILYCGCLLGAPAMVFWARRLPPQHPATEQLRYGGLGFALGFGLGLLLSIISLSPL